ncbi:hypothetical protein BGW36DRAFT_258995, partial [Talaromyces proteolyticus]
SSQQQSQQPQQQQADFQSAHNSHMDHSNYDTTENQLAGLVQAATAAAGQEVSDWATAAAAAAAAGHHHLEGYSADLNLAEDGFGDGAFGGLGSAPAANRQLRGSTANGQGQGLSRAVSKKRKRGEEALDPALTAAGGQGDQQQQAFDASELSIRELPPQQSLTDARAAGVHSAAALFRQPSNTKKYTRPPMSRLFASLELSPENFLHLQAAAKNYMLDDNHPERRECVGQRGKGDTEMVKLRLWNCVRDFLDAEGYGERFFGEHVTNEDMPPRQFIWPRDQHKIISLVIPLLRRMVTNERQRQYAIETRKGGVVEERKRRKTDDIIQDLNTSEHTQDAQHQHRQMHQHGHDHFLSAPPPPLPPHISSSSPEMGLGLSELVMDGYPADWDNVSKSYSALNQDYQLDTLWGVSGLQQPDWWGLVAAIDSHYQVMHHGNPTDCVPACEKNYMDNIISSDELISLDWRVGGGSDKTVREQFASSITRDLTRIIKENLVKRGQEPTPSHLNTPTHTETHGLSHTSYMQSIHQSPFDSGPATNHTHHDETSPITLRLNVIQDGKRVVPRLDVTAEQCPDLPSLRNLIGHRFATQLPTYRLDGNGNVDSSRWKIQVWLPEGLVSVTNDGDWTIAQLSAGTIDWMDNDLRVVVDI